MKNQAPLAMEIDSKFAVNNEGRIYKKTNDELVPLDEPLFLLRARDRLAIPLLKIYQLLSDIDGCNDFHMTGLEETIMRFVKFAAENPTRMKQPSVTRGL